MENWYVEPSGEALPLMELGHHCHGRVIVGWSHWYIAVVGGSEADKGGSCRGSGGCASRFA